MAVQARRSQFDLDFDEPYSYGAEQALSEKEPSIEELEAAIKETPTRPSMLNLDGHGRNGSSEPRAISDVIDDSERMLPLGSPSLRHTKGRLEDKHKMSPNGESYADVIKHEPPSPTTPSKSKPQDENTPAKNTANGRASQHRPSSPSITRKPVAKRVSVDDGATNGHSYADMVKVTAPVEPAQSSVESHKSTGVDSKERQAIETPHDEPAEQSEFPKLGTQSQDLHDTALVMIDQTQTEHSEKHESYAEIVKHEATSPSVPPQEKSEPVKEQTNLDKDTEDQSRADEDFADTATAVSEDGSNHGSKEKLESPRSSMQPRQKHQSVGSANAHALQEAPAETDILPSIDKTSDGDDHRPVYENLHSRSGTNLTSVQLGPAFNDSLAQEEKAEDQAPKTRLVSGRRAGAGWAQSAIRWAPLNVPLQRRLQTLAVLMHSLSIAGLLATFFALCAIPIFWPILLPYLLYVLLSRAPTDGKLTHRSEWIRRSKFWSLFASYFPARLHRTVELEPTRKYIFGYHPHGIISHGAFAAFTTEALGFAQLFPGITNTLLTLDSNFRVPLYRDWALRIGLASVSRESCENLLSKGGPNGEGMGRAITIVVGGARESLDAKPGTLNLVLAKRKGFIKLAVRMGADLVPVLAFGENDMYEQFDGDTHPWIHKGQLMLKKFMGFTVPLFHARGIFNYDVGIMPYRRPINIVVGRPIRTVQSKKPDPDYVDKLHKQYTEELLHIWEEWKDDFSPDRNCELQIVE